ncbi:MAG: type II CRISPR RNA-guided endonuclease Cas9 [Candidatus Mycalebacterium zealandia]|nr:MAG: type II CRISPR RNA-guided endonuclease Cas9 [Candidatus Mycalebacterium zealandia]
MKKAKLSEYTIGLDMGTNSIGWSVVEEKNGKPKGLVSCGSRIFIRSVEDKTPTPKNQNRREKRLLRRVIERRHRRKMRLRNYLISKEFLPNSLKDEPNPETELNKLGNPYDLRAKALDEELTPHKFGRAILHLGTRRGFLSNRKTGFGNLRDDPEVREILEIEDKSAKTDNDENKFKKDIQELRDDIKEAGKRTLGEHLSTLNRKRNRGEYHDRRTDRKMYQEEFEQIFRKQFALNPKIYTENVKNAIEKIIFNQRSIIWNKNTVGNCSLEPKKKRVKMERLEFQQFRYWQDINNLSWDDTETGERDVKPSPEQKQLIAETLEKNKNLTWAKIKTLFSLNKRTKFNLEKVEGKSRKGIKGNTTACGIREIIGDDWDDSLDDSKQKQLVEDLISYESKIKLKKRLQDHWKFDLEKAVKLAVLELEEGHGNLSLKAINKILPHLKEGRVYSRESDKEDETGAVQVAGYKDITKPKTGDKETLGELPFIPNPIVTKALYEVRRVVNAIIKEYGKPTAIRIEMSRDLEMNTEKYKRAEQIHKKNRKANEEAEEKYNSIRDREPDLRLKKYISHQDKLKYRLWKESECKCSYSGKSISLTDLWSSDVEIDHILPYSRSLDNSYMNKVICFAKENREKHNKTPWEAFGETEQWKTIESMAKRNNYPEAKCGRILAKKMEGIEDFVNSQLTDARYIAKETGKYMRTLGCDVTFTKGGITSWLRHQWGLNKILSETGEKNRADHRHHAIDATVIALTNRSLYQKIVKVASEASGDSIDPEHGLEPPRILDNLRNRLQEAVDGMIVSHATNRKITGAFHEDTIYGVREENGKKGIVVRKNLTDISDAVLKNKEIVSPTVREAFERYVLEQGNDLSKAKKALKEQPLKHPETGDAVRRVKVWMSKTFNESFYYTKKNKAGKISKVLQYGNNHHVEIIKNGETGKYESIVVTTMKAAERTRIRKEPIVKTEHGENREFVMSLCINDTVSVQKNGEKIFYRVRKIDRGQKNQCIKLILRKHTDGTSDQDFKKLSSDEKKKLELAMAPSTLMAEYKVKQESINALGLAKNNTKTQ